MFLNMTGVNEHNFYAIHATIQAVMFMILVLPSLILCILCVLGFLCTKTIHWQMKILLVNLFVAQFGHSLASSMLYLGYPQRALGMPAENYFCRFIISTFIVTSLSKSTAIAIYAVMVYIFVKHGISSIQQYIILCSIIISWLISISMGTMPYLDAFGVLDDKGFCESTPHSQVYMIPSGVVVTLVLGACTTLTLTFSSFTYYHVKKNTLEDSEDLRVAIAYNVVFLMMASVLVTIDNVIPIIYPILQSTATMNHTNKAKLVMDYAIQAVFDLPSLLLPISAVTLLKPVQISLKVMFKTCCYDKHNRCCCASKC